jgi:uncharacterized protein YgbK (DUF1537 family)
VLSGHAAFPKLAKSGRIAVVSGSCSPTTERQIRHALSQGFDGIEVDPVELVGEGSGARISQIAERGLAALSGGRSAIVYTALGGESDRSRELESLPGARHRVGKALGRVARTLIEQGGLKRAILAGGDTSSHALGELGIYALTTRLPLLATPGSPLCVAHSAIREIDGLEIAMKGGQIGGDDYFVSLRDGLEGPMTASE